jgi:hypothetical protein
LVPQHVKPGAQHASKQAECVEASSVSSKIVLQQTLELPRSRQYWGSQQVASCPLPQQTWSDRQQGLPASPQHCSSARQICPVVQHFSRGYS